MDFLLECAGFPPELDAAELAALVRRHGEPVAWRGPQGEHLRLDLGGGLELRLDRDHARAPLELVPYFRPPYRLRVGVEELRRVPDSPFDALLVGWVGPPAPGLELGWSAPGAYRISTWITDARRLPRALERGRVLALSIAGFALDVSFSGPDPRDPAVRDRPAGARIEPLGGEHSPGGTSELDVRVRGIRHLRNPLTGHPIEVLEVDAPERPLHLFLSPWQLREQGLELPRPGWRIEGTFLFTGRIAGGLPGPRPRVPESFG